MNQPVKVGKVILTILLTLNVVFLSEIKAQTVNCQSTLPWTDYNVYQQGDKMKYAGIQYEAKWYITGQIPTSDPNGPYTALGSCTDNVTIQDNCSSLANWSNTTVYTGGEIVVYSGNIFKARSYTQGQAPGSASTPWDLHGICDPNTLPGSGSGSSTNWSLSGNSNATATSFLGTTNNFPLLFKANNVESMRIATTGAVGINVPATNGVNNNIYYHKFTVNGPTNLVGNENALQISSPTLNANGTRQYIYFSNLTFPNSTTQYGNIGAYEFLEPNGSTQNGKALVLQAANNANLGVGAFTAPPTAKLSVNGTGYFVNNVGIGTAPTTNALEVLGTTKTTGLQIPTGAAAGKILTSDATGIASWQTINTTDNWKLTGNSITGTEFIGTTNNQPFILRGNNKEGLRISDGNDGASVSIGGAPINPYYYKFEVKGLTRLTGPASTNQVNLFNIYSGNNTTAKYLAGYRHYFSFTHETFTQNGEEYGVFNAVEFADAPPSGQPASRGKHMIIQKSTEGNLGIGFFNAPPAAKLTVNGSVAIGDNYVPAGYLMSVNGKIMATEIMVKLRNKWGDFCFAPEFKLMKLSEVEAYIKKHSHLPGVPSAIEIENNGLEVGEMENIMMQKVEQLYLYSIAQEKTIEEQKLQLETQKQKDTDQQAKIDQLLKLIEAQNTRLEKLENNRK